MKLSAIVKNELSRTINEKMEAALDNAAESISKWDYLSVDGWFDSFEYNKAVMKKALEIIASEIESTQI